MATYSSNTTIKVAGNATQLVGQNSSNAILSYTVPADSYLEFSLLPIGDTGGGVITIGGITVTTPALTSPITGMSAGPGTVISGNGGTTGSNRRLMMVGTLFSNTP